MTPSISIQLDYSYDSNGFFIGHPDRQSLLATAANALASRLNDSLSAIVPNPAAGDTWTAEFSNPGTGDLTQINNLTVAANTIIIFAGGMGGVLATHSTGGFSASGHQAWVDLVQGRGKPGALGPASQQTAYAPWGGSVAFDPSFADWYFGADPTGILPTQLDFLTVAESQLAFVLGFGTSDSWHNRVVGSTFIGPNAEAEYGGPVPTDAAGSAAGHWAAGTTDKGKHCTMVPLIPPGERDTFTPLDFAGLQDMGWTILPVGSVLNSWKALSTSDHNWNTSSNWSMGHSPAVGEVASFDATSNENCTINSGTNQCDGIALTSSYTGTITENADLTLLTSAGFVQASGTFNLNSSTIHDAGIWNRSVPAPGTFNAGTGTIDFNAPVGNQALDNGSTSLFNVVHSGAGTVMLTGNPLNVANVSNSTGTFDTNGLNVTVTNLQFNGGVLEVFLNAAVAGTVNSQVLVTGTVNLGNGVATLQENVSQRFPSGTKFLVIDNHGSLPISGFFSGLPEGAIFIDPAGNRFLITYKGSDSDLTDASAGDDFVVTSLPQFDIAGRASSTGQWWIAQSNGSAFTNAFATSWSTAVTWVDVHTGDSTGSGLQDIVGRVKETGQWWVSVPNSSGGWSTSLWDTWSTGVTWLDVKVGDFNGDGKMDIVGRAAEIGQWWVAQSTGSSFSNSLWATWSTAATWVDVQVGDFSGDGKADITGRWLEGGSWWTGVSNGSIFNTTQWGQWSPAVTWVDVNVGDFNGDGKADIVGRWAQAGQWWVGVSSGSSFTNALWGTWSTAATWVDVKVGDFNGDGKADITGRWLQGGSWWTAISNGSVFSTSQWGQWSTAATWVDVQVGDFNGDGKMDITGRWLEGGSWWTAVSNGTSFTTTQWTQWSAAVTWVDVHDGVFV